MTAPHHPAPTIGETASDHPDDTAAIARVIEDIEAGFNTNDADLLVGHFAEGGYAVGVTGVVLSGRAEMLEATRQLLAGPLREQYARYEIDDLRFPRPDVAIVRKLARAIDAAGTDIDLDHTMVALYVLLKRDGRWWVAARQNTLVAR
jgi:uncharacterized protein (TIGR02246 family)